MAVYDPKLNVKDALRMGYTRLVLINANADNSINLGLQIRQAVDFAPAYDYGKLPSRNPSFRAIGTLTDVCDKN